MELQSDLELQMFFDHLSELQMVYDQWWLIKSLGIQSGTEFIFFFTSGFLSDPGLAFVLQWPFSEQQTHYIVVT